EYQPYGTIATMRAGLEDAQPLRFPGQEASLDGAESYNIFRWYRAEWGRYTSSDPLGLAADLNLYGYVNQNPVRWSDPLGMIKPVTPKDQKWRECNDREKAQCRASCKYGMESCMVSQTFRVIRAPNGWITRGWVDGPMSCSCNEPDCWDKLKDWARQWTNPDPRPLPPMLPLPPFRPTPPLEPLPPPVWEPVPATPILPIFNPCMLNPSLCFGQGGPA
ncbi:MAG TPA: RHS repeat-associated core domain-containing protein, partial [Thermoanaerobaculia bacterium]|nr:RHS repeat-associated core domain-containing protein [Thermoanaerobaculia bacterium]